MKNTFYTYSFEKLEVWQKAREIRNDIYLITKFFPDHEKYGVISQIRRSSNSITDNLAEGSGRAAVPTGLILPTLPIRVHLKQSISS